MIIPESEIETKRKSDWVCVKVNSEKLYTKLPFDPFGEPADPIPTGMISIEHDVYVLLRSLSPDGRMKIGIMSLREEPGEVLEPPYLLNMDHVSMITKLSQESPLYAGLRERETGLVDPTPRLVVPNQ